MSLERFIENFTDLFEETEPDTIQATTRFKELDEWSSLFALSVIAMIDEEYDVELSPEEMRRAQTIEDLYNATKSHL